MDSKTLKKYWPLALSILVPLPWVIRVTRLQAGDGLSILTQAAYIVMFGIYTAHYARRERGLALAQNIVQLVYALYLMYAALAWGGGW